MGRQRKIFVPPATEAPGFRTIEQIQDELARRARNQESIHDAIQILKDEQPNLNYKDYGRVALELNSVFQAQYTFNDVRKYFEEPTIEEEQADIRCQFRNLSIYT